MASFRAIAKRLPQEGAEWAYSWAICHPVVLSANTVHKYGNGTVFCRDS